MHNFSHERIFPDKLTAFCIEGMRRSGITEKHAAVTANILITADTWGTFTHGTKSLRHYVQKVRLGGINPGAVPEVTEESAAWAIVDGHAGIGMVPSSMAMQMAIDKARSVGVAYVGVKNSSHFGAAGCYAVMAVEQDMIGLALSNADPNMAAPNARSPIIGNNPFAFAVPAGDEKPLMLDIAMSAAAAGKILAAKALRKPIPENWLVNGEGSPTADYSQWPGVGALLPMAGHKGYGLALLIEVLAGVITGSGVTKGVKSRLLDLPTPSNTGHAFLAIHAGAIMPIDRFKERMDALIREIRQSPLARGADRIYLPGELEWDRRERALRDGITFPADVLESLAGLAGDVGLDFCTIFN